MRITAVETVEVAEFSNIVWVRIHTDAGLIGLGETFRNPRAVVAYIHETCAPYLIGHDPLAINRHADALLARVGNHFNGYPTRSVEIRGNSAVDIALWDIFGQASGQSVMQLLGGSAHDRLRVYNTCASRGYNARARSDRNTVLLTGDAGGESAAMDDFRAQIETPGDLAESLLAEGITAMKIWPFDRFAESSRGQHISLEDLREGVRPVAEIRDRVGDRMDIMIEMHGLWSLPPAVQIARALADYEVYWQEDPVPMHNFADLAAFKDAAPTRVCGSEALGTPAWFREVFERGIVDVAHFDIGWIGGITAGRTVTELASAYDRPIAPHDCTGPVVFLASIHLAMSAPHALVQESVRDYYRGFYNEIVTDMPRIADGYVHPIEAPGLGTRLRDDFLARDDIRMVRTPD